jgi:LacI family transcriptional regulator
MPPAPSKRKIIAVAFPSITETELALIDGIRDGIPRNWEMLVVTGGYESILRQLAEMKELSGAIGDFVSDAWLQTLSAQGVAVVQLAQCSHLKGVANIAPDYLAMGSLAAQTLRNNGVRSFAFAGAPGQYASSQLFEGFAGEIARGGGTLSHSSGVSQVQVREALRPLERPLGMFAATDRLARFAVLAARELGWKIPQELAVIGTGNLRLESLYAGIPLSSYELPGRELGRLAMQCLVNGTPPPEPSPMALLHERQSSLRAPTGLERAFSYARSNLDQPLQVGDLCRAAGMSRRSLENAMQSRLGTSPSHYLQSLRQERAETLLRTTQMSIQSIAQACGYPEPSVFATAFRRWTGATPSAFRDSTNT